VDVLITLCAGSNSCHEAVTGKVMRLHPQSDRGMSGPVLVDRWSDGEWGFVTVTKAA
jgi:hypothetical protein